MEHAGFILASYGITAAVILALVARAVLDHKTQSRALAELESRGSRRRSARG
jgi:heme exporter protein D